jgi:hypothetical protein
MSGISLETLKKGVESHSYSLQQMKSMLGSWKGYVKMGKGATSSYKEKISYLEKVIKEKEGKTNVTSEPVKKEVSLDEQIARKFIQLKGSADKRGKDWNLTLADIRKLLQRKTCHYTGVKFTEEGKYARTVDRIDNTKGYVKGNVVACTHWANQMKNELFELPDPMIKHMKKLISKVEEL